MSFCNSPQGRAAIRGKESFDVIDVFSRGF